MFLVNALNVIISQTLNVISGDVDDNQDGYFITAATDFDQICHA